VHSGPESTRHEVDVAASRHDMEDTYFPAFRATVMEAKAQSVMCAYNSLNGQPACANAALLQEHLRKDWGFGGYVVTDCGAMRDINVGHGYAKTLPEAAAIAFKTGTDNVCAYPVPNAGEERQAILDAIKQGLLPEANVDQTLRRLFTARFQLGMFDPPAMVPFSKITAGQNNTEEHRQLNLKTAREAIVLLKNKDNLLPLKKTYNTIAVIGPNADSHDALEGNYNGTPSNPVTVLAGIRKRFTKSKIVYVQGSGLVGPAWAPIPSTALFTDESMKTHGLNGEYFSNTDLKGTPVFKRTDADVNFTWATNGVNSDLLKNYSVRWTGVLSPEVSGDYVVGFSGQEGYRAWLDGNQIADDWTLHRPASSMTKPVHLEKGHAYPVKIEYFQTVRNSEAKFIWGLPATEKQRMVDAVRSADLAIVVAGLSARVEGEEMKVAADGFTGGDRTRIDLPAPQQEMLEQVYNLGKPTVLVLMNGSALAVNWADEKIPAILEAWYPGGEGGTAVAEALAGDFSPGGRLPITFYKSVDQLPPFEDYSMAKRTYRYFDGEPLYPFGYGLSYTSFTYSNVKVDNSSVAADGSVTISVDVANTGAMAGDEVVQLYLTHTGVAGAPLRALQGFQRVHLKSGEKKTISFTLRDRSLSVVDEAGKRRIVPGPVNVWIGGGQPIVRSGLPKTAGVEAKFTITSEAALPD
jgi:beta-glucosidase